MNFPVKFSAVYSGTPIVKKILDATDNLILADIATAAVAGHLAVDMGLSIPTGTQWLDGFNLGVDNGATIEIGIVKSDGSVFISVYTVSNTRVNGSSVQRRLYNGGPEILHDGTTWFAAVRITGTVNGTIVVTGDIELHQKG